MSNQPLQHPIYMQQSVGEAMDLICLFRYILLEILSSHPRTHNNISISFITHRDVFNKGCPLKGFI